MPYTGTLEEFAPKVDDKLLAQFKDASGDIRFEKVFEWLLPRFGEKDEIMYFDWVAAWMRNYMQHIITTKEYKPRYFNLDPEVNLTILGSHIACFYRCHMDRMLHGFPLIDKAWSKVDHC